MAYLPDSKKVVTINDLEPGEKTWVVPWAMKADQNGKLWLDTSFTQGDSKGGTVDMIVERCERAGDFKVDASHSNHRWQMSVLDFGDPSLVEISKVKF